MERSIAIAYAVWVLTALAITAVAMFSVAHRTAIGLLAVVTSSSTLLTSVVLIALRSTRASYGVVVPAIVSGCVLASALADPLQTETAFEWWGVQHLLIGAGLITGCLPRRAAVIVLSPYLALYAVSAIVVSVDPPTGLWWSCLLLMMATLAMACVRELRATGVLADTAVHRVINAAREQEELIAATKIEAEVVRRLHDDVAHALRAAALPSPVIDSGRVRSQAQDAVRALDLNFSDDESGLRARVGSLCEATPLEVKLTVGDFREPPSPVADALVGILGEGLRNVERHSGQDRAAVELGCGEMPASVRLTLADKGAGFGHVTPGFGLRASVSRRALDIGAQVEITAPLGSGVCIAIDWTPPRPPARDQSGTALLDLAGTRWRIIRGTLLPFVLGSAVLIATHPYRLAAPLSLIATGVMWLTGLLVILGARKWLVGRRLARFVMGGVVAGIWLEALPWGMTGSPGSSYAIPAIVAPLLAVLAYHRPVWEVVITLLVVEVSVTWLIARAAPDGVWLGAGLGAAVSPLVAVAAVLLIRLVLERFTPIVEAAFVSDVVTAARQEQLKALQQVGEQRIARVSEQVRPFLTGIAGGKLIVGAPAVRRQAEILEAAVRDDLHLGTALSHEARTAIHVARESGVTVEVFGPTGSMDEEASSRYCAVVVQAVHDVAPGGRVVVTVDDNSSAITALVDPAEGSACRALAGKVGGTVRGSAGLVLVSVPLSPRSGTCTEVGAPVESNG